jgi:hypothetical protein
MKQQVPDKVSQLVRQLIDYTPPRGIEIGDLIERVGKEGLLITIMVLTFPFLLPVSIPGTSTPFGTLIVLICISILTHKTLRLPRKLSSLRIQQRHMLMIANRAANVLEKMEQWSKPRLHGLTSSRAICNVHAVGIILNALCMMLPLPLPFSNAIPAYGIVFLSLGLLRKDGLMIGLGYLMLIAIIIYLTVIYMVGAAGIRSLLEFWSL